MAKQCAVISAAAALVASIAVALFFVLYGHESAPPIVIDDSAFRTEVVVSVEGAVTAPGVYHLPNDARMVDAITAAGGFASGADLSEVNMAARLTDEQRIVILSSGPDLAGSPMSATAGVTSESAGAPLININTADALELDSLPGIGPVLAGRIVTYREANGPFTRIEELARVDGISMATVDKLRDRITVGQ